jgi:hypothetical protein
VERETTKHDPRVDEAMDAETRSLTRGAPVESRRRDERLKEPITDDEPSLDPSARPGPASALSPDEAAIRGRLGRLLEERAEFPSDRNALIRSLGEADERGELVARLRMLPVERTFADAREVVLALSGMSTEEPPG